MRRLLFISFLAMLATSCSGSDDADVTSTTTPLTTTVATTSASDATEPTATAATPATTTSEAAETTTTTSTTSTTIVPGPGVLALTRVVFEPVVYVTVTNVGNGPAELSTYWLCQRPAYQQLPQLVLEAGDTVAIGLGTDRPPDLVEYAAVIELGPTLGAINKADGEMGLYLDPFFDDSGAIGDYVEWGFSGHGRSDVAVQAGIWADGSFVEVPVEATSISSSGTVGAGVEDWTADVGG